MIDRSIFYRWPLAMLFWVVTTLPLASGCSSDEPTAEEQSQVQSEVLGQHFSGRRPEALQPKK